MSSCKDMDRLIQLYVDQEIEEADRKRLGEHVAECNICRNDLQEMIKPGRNPWKKSENIGLRPNLSPWPIN